ncbi:MAG: hypothetical protein RL072_222 [Actinomycetota bacterium]
MCVIGWIYEDVLTRAAIAEIRRWVAPIVAAVVLEALWKLRTTAVRDAKDAMVVVLALVGAVLGVAELLVLLIVGAASIAFRHPRTGVTRDRTGVPGTKMNLSPVFLGAATIVGAATVAVPLWKILVVFLQIGSVIYGSGYVLLVFLESEIVARGWISPEVLLDSISVGQFTPGPVFTTATFIGWHLAGFGGAVAATVGIFGPSFVFASFVERIVSWSQRWRMFASFLRGVSSGSIALIAFVLVRLADDAFIDTFAVGTFVASLAMIVGVPWLWRVRRARLG